MLMIEMALIQLYSKGPQRKSVYIKLQETNQVEAQVALLYLGSAQLAHDTFSCHQ